jgi:hypothetical protein
MIDDAVKWKLESETRKILDRIAFIEDRSAHNKRMTELITNECHTEFNDLKNQIVQMTTDVLQ